MIAQQIDLFAEMEREAEENEYYHRQLEDYHRWLITPDITRVADGTPERSGAVELYAEWCSDVYSGLIHRCTQMPADEYMWCNYVSSRRGVGEYWVLAHKTIKCNGKHEEVCPYCGADLARGHGDVMLEKADFKRWCEFLHTRFARRTGELSDFDVEMHKSILFAADRSAKDWTACRRQKQCPMGKK